MPDRPSMPVFRHHALRSAGAGRLSPSCSAPATSTPPSATRAWWRRWRSSRCQAGGVRGRRRCRHLRLLRRTRRPVSAGRSRFGGADALLRRPPPAWLRQLAVADLSVDGWLSLPAPAVPGAVVENVNEAHIRKAIWLFPLYLLLINLFVLPIAGRPVDGFGPDSRGGCRHVRAGAADAGACEDLALLVFRRPVGGDRHGHRRDRRPVHHGLQRSGDAAAAARPRWLADRGRPLRACCSASVAPASRRRAFAGLSVFPVRRRILRAGGQRLVSFAAAAQFAPPILIGLFWKRANRLGRVARFERRLPGVGLYPAAARHGPFRLDRHASFIEQGPFGLELFALRAVRPRPSGPLHARGVLEHAGSTSAGWCSARC
jgi:hypothetical protein